MVSSKKQETKFKIFSKEILRNEKEFSTKDLLTVCLLGPLVFLLFHLFPSFFSGFPSFWIISPHWTCFCCFQVLVSVSWVVTCSWLRSCFLMENLAFFITCKTGRSKFSFWVSFVPDCFRSLFGHPPVFCLPFIAKYYGFHLGFPKYPKKLSVLSALGCSRALMSFTAYLSTISSLFSLLTVLDVLTIIHFSSRLFLIEQKLIWNLKKKKANRAKSVPP